MLKSLCCDCFSCEEIFYPQTCVVFPIYVSLAHTLKLLKAEFCV